APVHRPDHRSGAARDGDRKRSPPCGSEHSELRADRGSRIGSPGAEEPGAEARTGEHRPAVRAHPRARSAIVRQGGTRPRAYPTLSSQAARNRIASRALWGEEAGIQRVTFVLGSETGPTDYAASPPQAFHRFALPPSKRGSLRWRLARP